MRVELVVEGSELRGLVAARLNEVLAAPDEERALFEVWDGKVWSVVEHKNLRARYQADETELTP